jgi:hypothetical protein
MEEKGHRLSNERTNEVKIMGRYAPATAPPGSGDGLLRV